MTTKKTVTKGFDLADLQPTANEVVVKLKTPKGEIITKADGSPQTITVAAPYSKEFKAATHAAANERIERNAKQKSASGELKITAEDIDENTVNFLVKITKGYDLEMGGKAVEFSKEFTYKLYDGSFIGIREQVEAELDDTTNFTKL